MMTLTDDQRMLQDSVAPFMAEEGAIKTQLRHWRDIGCKDGFGHGLWKQFAELGLTGILIPEAQGGAGLGQVEAGVVLEEIGRNLTPSPFLMTSVAAVRALELQNQPARQILDDLFLDRAHRAIRFDGHALQTATAVPAM